MQLFESYQCETPLYSLYIVVWWSDHQEIFSTPTMMVISAFGAKRTSDLSSVPQHYPRRIHSSLYNHLSLHKTSIMNMWWAVPHFTMYLPIYTHIPIYFQRLLLAIEFKFAQYVKLVLALSRKEVH